ncbi:MAG: hypothetical protein A2020_03250 [Lentisphaerae bacterium GWF2_45_14]|nr:MAG: hypothetical protein A2020_03250 [Lentisphaerae bacterium GWF2_45_14]
MNFSIRTFFSAAALFCLNACMQVDYKGEIFQETDKVDVFKDKSKITAPYKIMGSATASGPYEKYPKEDMIKELKAKAMASGADAILITSYEVLPDDQVRGDQFYSDTVGKRTNDDSSDDLARIGQDFDKNYGQYGKADNSPEIRTYRRIIKADFLKYCN